MGFCAKAIMEQTGVAKRTNEGWLKGCWDASVELLSKNIGMPLKCNTNT